ncbi:MAG: CDP-alcohol phosphatidyltransferase family protein [Candidatus Competibacteraceae bacterium]|nr:CDP-alcohol phosphatidyltransferase family protein [Candidatus Competibacteraceae bacterium]
MVSLYHLKPQFQNGLRPIVRQLARWGVSANQVTLAAVGVSGATGLLIAWFAENDRLLLLLPAVLFVRMALNAIDGMLAREHGMTTPLGALLNELGDAVSDTALYLPLALVPGMPTVLIILLVILALLTELAGMCAVQIGAQRRYDGPMGKSDRALVLGTVALLLGFGLQAGLWLTIVLIIINGLLLITLVNRIRNALLEANS